MAFQRSPLRRRPSLRRQHLRSAAGRVRLEQLENRQLFTLLGVNLELPLVTTQQGTQSYNATSLAFDASSIPVQLQVAPGQTVNIGNATGAARSTQVHIVVNHSGGLVSGDAARDDLSVVGRVVVGNTTYNGVLLRGEILPGGAFGYSDTSALFDFRFKVSGGLLAPAYFAGKDIGMVLQVEGSTYTTTKFNGNWSGVPKATIGPVDSNTSGGPPLTALSGHVYVDANNNGVRDEGELPIPGTTVQAVGVNADGTFTTTTTTDANGAYLFSNIPAGTYRINETQPASYLDGLDAVGTVNGSPSGSVLPPDSLTQIGLPVNGVGVDYDFGEIGSSISGYVYHDANNDGTFGPTESPIPGTTVTLTGKDSSGANVNLTATTDASGFYSFTGLKPADANGYTLTESQPANYLDGKDTIGTPGGNTSNDQFSAINLPVGYNGVNNNFGELLPSSISGYVYHDANNDGTFQNTESPIGSVPVVLTGTDDLGQAVSLATTTNALGYYEFTNLRPGTYQLNETQPAAYLDGKDTVGTPGGDTTNDQFANVSLPENYNGANNNFGELLPASISGYVYSDANDDGVFDSTESPIPNTTVALTGVSDLGQTVTFTTTTDSAGYYEFTALRPGTYTVTETQPANYLDGKDTQGTPGTGTTGNDVFSAISIAAGTNGQNNNFGELLPASLGDRVWVDANRDGVQDAGEASLPNVTVTLYDANGNVLDTTTTNSTGIYGFNNLLPGTYSVGFTLPAGYVFTAKDAAAATDATDSDADSVTGLTASTTLAAGQADLTLDAGVYALAPAVDIEKYVNPEAIPVGGEGLTPGFWKQSQHFYAWTNFHTTDSYNAVFGVNDPAGSSLTLLDALARGGGANKALGRHAVAALLNAANPNVSYLYTAGQIIALVQNAYATGDFDSAKNLLAQQNELEADLSTPAVFTPTAPGYGYDADTVGSGPTVPAGTQLTFTFVVKNTGETPLINVVVTDDNATPADPSDDFAPTYVSGDTNHDSILDLNETWVYTYVTNALDGTHTNTASVVGANPYAPAQTVTDADAANYGTGSTPAPASAAIGDRVWVDANKNGIQDSGEAGLANVTVNLLDASGNVVDTTTTDSTGHYAFTDLAPGNYKVQFVTPAGYALTTGDAGASDAADSDADSTGATTVTTLSAGETDNTWDAGFYQLPVNNSSISGTVFSDLNNDGDIDANEAGIKNVKVVLTGYDDLGHYVEATDYTDDDGFYQFTGLRDGTYKVTETQPADYLDGKDSLGSLGGTLGNDVFSNVSISGGNKTGINYNFGEIAESAPCGPALGHDMTATIGFWQNKNGQALIKSLNGSANCTKLGNWLATNLPNLFGNTPGAACNLSGKTNTQVAAAFVSLFNVKGTKTEAQVMAAALAVYATDSDLAGGAYAKSYGFIVNTTGTGAATFNVGSNGSALGLTNNQSYTISQILAAADNVDAFDRSSSTQTSINNLFTNINETGDI